MATTKGKRTPRGIVRPPDPKEVLRIKKPGGRAKIRVVADVGDGNEPQIQVQGAPVNGATEGSTVFAVDGTGVVTCEELASDGTVSTGGDFIGGGDLEIPGAANAASFVASADMHADDDVTADGDIVAQGVVTSVTPTSKKVWIPGLSFVGLSGTMGYSTTKGAMVSSGTGHIGCSLSQYLRIGTPAAKITSIVGYWGASGSEALTLYEAPTASTFVSGSDASQATANSTDQGGGVWAATLSGLSVTADDTHTLWLDAVLANTQSFYGVLVTFEDAVI